MIEHVKHLGTKLHVEILRDLTNVIVFEYREVNFSGPGTDQDVAAGVATKIETTQIPGRKRYTESWRCRVTVRIEKRLIRRRWYGEALIGLEVSVWISGISQ